MEREREVLQIIHQSLNDDVAIRELDLDADQRKILRGFQFLSEKPMLYLVNVGEEQLAEVNTLPPELEKYAGRPRAAGGQIGGQVEMEIAGLEDEDREVFMQDYGIRELAAERLIRQCYDLMDYITYFTAAEKESHAWTITRGMKAPQAAGVIHSDFERGFIRAEVIPYSDLMELGSIPAAKKVGKLRLEGKDYVVQDGDVILFLFNV
jgi:ribosome-binding ATPase YchF (GTP1/OBG family)